MPYQDKKKKLWVGQVKKVIKEEGLEHLIDLPLWKQKSQGVWVYHKLKRWFKTKTAASNWERDHWEDILNIQVYPDPSTLLTFSTVSTIYLKQVELRAKGINTLRYKKKTVKDPIIFWGEDPPLPIETIDLENYLDEVYEEHGGKKANRELRELNTLFNWMKSRHYIDDLPTSPINQYDEKEFKKYVPPKEHIHKAIQIASAFEKDLLKTAYHTLARSIELRRLKKTDCDFINNKVWLSTRKRKGGSLDAGAVDMNSLLREILYRRCKTVDSEYVFPAKTGEQLSKDTLDNVMPRIFKHLNNIKGDNGRWAEKPEDEQTKPFTLHAIRHHVAAHLYMNHGYTAGEMQIALRHKRASTTDEYLKSIVDMKSARGLSVLADDNFETKSEPKQAEDVIAFPSKI